MGCGGAGTGGAWPRKDRRGGAFGGPHRVDELSLILVL
eukprot:COSAG01_NODE_37615_length_501_cov_0.733831_1_plen_37_part_01